MSAKHFRLLKLAIALAALAGGLVLLWPASRLTAECNGKRLFAWPIRVGEACEVIFTHSVNQSPITDIIQWTGQDLVVVKSRFKAFGAGVPVPSDGVGTEMIRAGESYELVGIDKAMPDFTVMTQTVPDHAVRLGTREARLLELVGSGRQVTLAVKSVLLHKTLTN
jgi:hypothetical protein